MKSQVKSHRRISAVLAVLLVLLLFWLSYQPKATSEMDLAQRRALLDEAIRQRDEIPAPHAIAPVEDVPMAAVEPPPQTLKPVQLKQESPPQDTYREEVQRYLHQLELRHYDDMARRKEDFDQRVKKEENQIAGQWAQLENFQAPRPQVILSDAVKRRMTYCIRCHDKRDSRDMAEFFARADTFH